MKKAVLTAAPLLPLVVVAAFAIGGITMNPWVYVILAVVCPAAAGALWYLFKDTEGKMHKSRRLKGRIR